MSDAKRDEKPLTETDSDVDLDAVLLGSGVERRPGVDLPTSPVSSSDALPATSPEDAEPRTVPPSRLASVGAARSAAKLGPPRLRAPTLVGVAPPSSAAAAPKTTPASAATRERAEPGVPKIEVAGVPDEETTTLVGKMLAEAAAQARRKLEENVVPTSDTYQDETATNVGDAEHLIATANEVFAKAAHEASTRDEATVARARSNPRGEETTAKRDPINVDGVLARAAEVKAQIEAEAKRKKAAKKRTFVGLGNGPLTLPASKPGLSDKIEMLEDAKNLSLPDLSPRPSADEETLDEETVTAVAHEAPVSPVAPHERKATIPVSEYTEPMPHGPPLRLDFSGASPAAVAPPYDDLPPGTPPGGVAPAPFPPMPASPPNAHPSDPAAFAQTPPPRKTRGGSVLVLLVLLAGAGAGAAHWQRVPLMAAWERYRTPPFVEPAEPVNPSDPAVVSSPTPSAHATPAVPASASSSASPSASPSASAEPAPSASASASASSRPAPKPAPKKPPAKRKSPRKRAPAPTTAPTAKHGF